MARRGARERLGRGDGLEPVAERAAIELEGIEHRRRRRPRPARGGRTRTSPLGERRARRPGAPTYSVDRKLVTGTIGDVRVDELRRRAGRRRRARPMTRATRWRASDGDGDAARRTGRVGRATGARRCRSAPRTALAPDPPAEREHAGADHEDDGSQPADDGGRDQPRRPPAFGTHGMGPVSRRDVLSPRVEVRVADAHRRQRTRRGGKGGAPSGRADGAREESRKGWRTRPDSNRRSPA